MRRRTLAAVSVGALALVTGVAVIAVGALAPPESGSPPESVPTQSGSDASPSTAPIEPADAPAVDAVALAQNYLENWVDDGRVVRRDEGGDTVSEGQAYGLLAAVIASDEAAFDEIWAWTDAELVRPDGLLAWRWEDGAVVDEEPASDADLDAARALVLAGGAFDRADLTARGVELAGTIADLLTVETDLGRVLLPGLWAAAQDPYAYNPSYASPAAFEQLAAATGDTRWSELQAGSRAATSAILAATDLPPDWAQIHGDGLVEAMPGARGNGDPVQYGFDAPRMLVRYAEACDATDAALVGATADTLARETEPAGRLDLGGAALTEDRSALSLVARAAASASAGEDRAARIDLQSAADLAAQYPTYYGQAWVMLGASMLTGDALGGCPAIDGRTS